MRRPVSSALVLLLLAGAGSAQAAEPRASRSRVSKSGLYSVRLVQAPDKSCKLEVLKEGAPVWELGKCVGSPDDLYFVSDDGQKVWVLVTIPHKGKAAPARKKKGKKKAKRYPAWSYGQVAFLYDRSGNVLQVKRLNDFVRTPAGLNNVRQLTRHFKWLEGVAGVPGNPPRLNEEGQVELDTLEPKTFRLDF